MTKTTISRTLRSRGCVIGSRWLPSITTRAICTEHGSETTSCFKLYSVKAETCCKKLILPFTTNGTKLWWLNGTVSLASFFKNLEERHFTFREPDHWWTEQTHVAGQHVAASFFSLHVHSPQLLYLNLMTPWTKSSMSFCTEYLRTFSLIVQSVCWLCSKKLVKMCSCQIGNTESY